MAATMECTGCGSADLDAGATCAVCGADGAATDAAEDRPSEAAPELRDGRRVRGLAVPLVAAAVVAGIGIPLTAGAVTLLSGSSRTDASGWGRARLAGAVTADGAATPVGCRPGAPLLVTVGNGSERYSILLSVPVGSKAGTYLLTRDGAAFVTVSHPATSRTWTSRDQAEASGEIDLRNGQRNNQRVFARFEGLGASSSKAAGTVGGAVDVRCG